MSSLENIKSLAPNVSVVLVVSAMLLVWLMYRTEAQSRRMGRQITHIERKLTRVPEPSRNHPAGSDDAIGGPTFHDELDVKPVSETTVEIADADTMDTEVSSEGDSGN